MKWTLLLILSISIFSCKKFLDLKPKDTKVVSTQEDYRDILASYMRLIKTPNTGGQINVFGIGSYAFPAFNPGYDIGIMSGEVNMSLLVTSPYYNLQANDYTESGRRLMNWTVPHNDAWERNYIFTGPLSLIINEIDNSIGDDQTMKNYVKGEALVWRAYAYYKILQYYSPYKNDKYGITIFTDPANPVGVYAERKTQTECYQFIINDCMQALALLDKTPSQTWNIAYNIQFIHAMLADIYMYKAMSGAAAADDWQKAIDYATKAIGARLLSKNTNDIIKMFDGTATGQTMYSNDEFSFRIVDGGNGRVYDMKQLYYNDEGNGVGYASPDIIIPIYNMFEADDIRKPAYYKTAGDGTSVLSDKYNLLNSAKGGVYIPFRLANSILIKAEGLARAGRTAEAATALKTLLDARYINGRTPPADNNALLSEILRQRQLEFFQENDMRWIDMKRLQIPVTKIINGNILRIAGDDFRYTFPIPSSEMNKNKKMVQNPGWENYSF